MLLGFCGYAFDTVTTEITEDYRPDYHVRTLSADSLAKTSTVLRHGSVTLLLNWSASIRGPVDRGPYRLEVMIRPRASNFEAIVVDSLRIFSDRADYSFADSIRYPLRLERRDRFLDNRVFEPALPFDYDGGEEVTTRIWYRVINTFDSLPQYSEIRWVPVRTKRFVPFV